jgi:hypothetical protein
MRKTISQISTDQKYSLEMLDVVSAWNSCEIAGEGDEFDAPNERLKKTVDTLIERGTPSLPHAGELALVWRLRLWRGDECHSVDADPRVERALWKCIERLTGMSMREVQTVELV